MRLSIAMEHGLLMASRNYVVFSGVRFKGIDIPQRTLYALLRRGLLEKSATTGTTQAYRISDAGRQWIKDNTND